MSMKPGRFIYWFYLVISNKSKDLLRHFERYCNQKYEKWKNTKIGLGPMPRQKNLEERNSFIRIPISNFPEIRHLGTFESILLNGRHGNSG